VLCETPHWLAYRLQPQGSGRSKKVPIDPRLRTPLRSWTDSRHWLRFPDAVAAAPLEHGGVGYVLDTDDGYVVLDGDGCRDPNSGALAPWVEALVARLASFSEASVSGTGIHIWVRAQLPAGTRRQWVAPDGRGKLELYQGRGRFITVSGQHLAGTPLAIEDRHVELVALINDLGLDGPADAGCTSHIAARPPASRTTAGSLGIAETESIAHPEAVAAWLDDYASSHPHGADRSAAFCALVRACYRAHGAEATRAQVERINVLTGRHHATAEAAARDLDRILTKFGLDRREDAAVSISASPPSPAEMETAAALGERLKAAEARAARAEAALAAAHAALAAQREGRSWEQYERELQMERRRCQQLLTVAGCLTMTYRDRIIAILAMDQTDAIDLPRAAGEDRPPPRRLHVAALKERLGLAPTSNAPAEALAEAARHGFITRTVETEPTDEQGTGFRTSVYIGPGTGVPEPIALEERRAARRTQPADHVTVQERAAQRATQGCPSCGGELHPCEWACDACGTRHSAAALAGNAPAVAHESTAGQACAAPPDPMDSVGQIHGHNRPTESVGHGDAAGPPCVDAVAPVDARGSQEAATGHTCGPAPDPGGASWGVASDEDWDRIFPPVEWPPGHRLWPAEGHDRRDDRDSSTP
jgi:hypothetical protein